MIPSGMLAAALAPFRQDPDLPLTGAFLREDASRFCQLLVAQGLAPYWYRLTTLGDLAQVIPEPQSRALRASHHAAIASYLLQRKSAADVSGRLSRAGIPCAVFKGAALRDRLFKDPALRAADDVDVLIAPEHRDAAIQVLAGAGFAFRGQRETISHEAMLRDGYVTVDMHWALFRPGRSRFELASYLLATARRVGDLSVLSDDANLVVLLVHSAFAKHVNGRAAKLIRVVDLDRLLRLIEPDWDWILRLIDAAGLRTAAWAVLYWTRSLMDTPVDPAVMRHLEPGRLKGRYLAYWIDHQLPARLGGIPGLVQGAFTLALHERPGDVVRALAQLGKARLESRGILQHLQRVSQAPD